MKRRGISWALLLATTAALLAGCGQSYGEELTAGLEWDGERGEYLPSDAQALNGFGAKLLQKAGEERPGENILLSPLSAAYALGMTANGAKGRTLEQMEEVLGLPSYRLNQAFGAYLQIAASKDDPLRLANSIWVNERESFHPNQDFLEQSAGQYQAQVYRGPFDEKTLKQINAWVSARTEGRIPRMLEEFQDDDVMILLNALCFEAKWMEPYEKRQVREGEFITEAGETRQAQMMYSKEFDYISMENAQGFCKPYQGGRYAFAALLPDEGIAMGDFLAGLDGQSLFRALNGARNASVLTAIPQFSDRGDYQLQGMLQSMGMTDAFDGQTADFSGMGVSENGPLYIGQVRQKTFIEVDDQGTKAAASTLVDMKDGAAQGPIQEPYQVYLDRPFVYLLVDRQTNTPLMMGVMYDVEEAR